MPLDCLSSLTTPKNSRVEALQKGNDLTFAGPKLPIQGMIMEMNVPITS